MKTAVARSLAGRVAWFHEPHSTADLTARAHDDRAAWLEYVAWHKSAADPASMTVAQCREAIAGRLAASGPLRVSDAHVRLEALGFASMDAQRILAGSRRHPGTPSAGIVGGVRAEVSYRSRRYHVATSPAGREQNGRRDTMQFSRYGRCGPVTVRRLARPPDYTA
jgi:hypothetical protein